MQWIVSNQKRWVIGLLAAAAAVLLIMAVREKQAVDPPGWVAMNEQVEKSLNIEVSGVSAQSPVKEPGQLQSTQTATGAELPIPAATASAPNSGPTAAPSETTAPIQADTTQQHAAPGNDKGNAAVTEATEATGTANTNRNVESNNGGIDINLATAEQLMTLSGIGEAKANAIIADRNKNGPFRSVDDLQRVKGIGSKMLEKLRPSIVVKP